MTGVATVSIYKHNIPVLWDGEIEKGTTLRVYAYGMEEAIAALELLLDRRNCRKFWYQADIAHKARAWHFMLIDAPTGCWNGWTCAEARARAVNSLAKGKRHPKK